jgi:hypothetical protein
MDRLNIVRPNKIFHIVTREALCQKPAGGQSGKSGVEDYEIVAGIMPDDAVIWDSHQTTVLRIPLTILSEFFQSGARVLMEVKE